MTSGEDLKAIAGATPAEVLLCGHTHQPFQAEAGGKIIINAGAVSLCDGACYGLLDVCGGKIRYTQHCVEYDLQKVLKDADQRGFPDDGSFGRRLKGGAFQTGL